MEKDYNNDVEAIRLREYPHMNKGIYLDHSGATIYAKSAIESFTQKMISNLYGNPHSENLPAQLSGDVVDEVREKTLRFLGADPEHFDLVFVANATAAIKLVAEAFRDLAEKSRARRFWYGFHKDAHTSLVGVREFTHGQHHCFESDEEVEAWLRTPTSSFVGRYDPDGLGLFAYPGQSNMSGRRLPLSWAGRMRRSEYLNNTYTLFDAAALAMTSSMEPVFRDPNKAPDFTCLSLYKIFGFPDLGALVVRRDSGHILALRKYFGGGTVTMVSAMGGHSWHRSKGLQAPTYKLHEGLEDGTLPFHSILALGVAIDVHKKIYRSMDTISSHTSFLTSRLFRGMAQLRHGNGVPVCRIYSEDGAAFGDPIKQGSVIAFNVITANGQYLPYSNVERLANSAGIYIRSGGVCNPGGIFSALGYEPWMMERSLSAGHHCGSHGIAVIHRLPTGIVRASVGAMTTKKDVDTFLDFMRDTFVEHAESWADSPRSTLCSAHGESMALDVPNHYTYKAFPDVPGVASVCLPGSASEPRKFCDNVMTFSFHCLRGGSDSIGRLVGVLKVHIVILDSLPQ
ncbi:putative Pyridoxal phosphate-dependent transferase [Seiridium cardinale]|uniref:Pyridoxal phosphate-dependent transferase n=1 Tax=Seiridium cardinale TaxID=138064 RepID=A0ABR2XBK4_9PEZI